MADRYSKISASDIVTRDHLLVRIINGVTKSGVHVDRKKRADKYVCRRHVDMKEW